MYDLGIIGSGPAGLAAAYSAAARGLKVVIIEKYLWGGTCPNYGCDPKKILLTAIESVERVSHLHSYGVVGNLSIDWKDLQANRRQYTDAVEPRKIASLEKAGIDYIRGTATFKDDKTIVIDDQNDISATNWIIAVGQKPRILDFEGQEFTLNYEQFLSASHLGKEVAFIGAGYVGMEFATIALGAGSKTHMITHGDSALRSFDQDMVKQVVDDMKEKGTDFHFNTQVEKIIQEDDKFRIYLSDGNELLVDQVFNTAGRVGNHAELNLDTVGVDFDQNEIYVNEFMQTSLSNIYAIGDVAKSGVGKLVPTGNFQGRYVVEHIIGEDTKPIKYPAIASVVFTSPRIAQVGILAKDADDTQKVKTRDLSKWITYYRNHEKALVKSVINKDQTVAGGAVMALEAEEVINYIVEAINRNDTHDSLASILYSYPSYGSDIRDII